MTDITATIALGASAGAGAAFVAATGVDPIAIVCASIGAIVGVGAAQESGRWRAILVFVAVVFLSALIGTAIAAEAFKGALLWRNTLSALVAVLFHPMLASLVAFLPKVFEAVLARVSGQGSAKP